MRPWWKDGGFTLIEIALSLGIIAVVMAGVLALLGGLFDSSRESWEDSRAAMISRQILTDLTSGTGHSFQLQAAANQSPSPVPVITGSTPSVTQVYYDREGVIVSGNNDPNGFFEADITLRSVDSKDQLPFDNLQIAIHPKNQGSNIAPFLFYSRIAPNSTGTN